MPDIIIVGAGVAGLVCARQLVSAGKTVQLLERSRGVGGRCATRRIEGQSIDHGLAFFHGNSSDFLRALQEVPGRWIPGWPNRVQGRGTPCQPNAFARGTWRYAHGQGVNAFPKHLARGLDVELQTAATGFELTDNGVRIRAIHQGLPISFTGGALVLALPGPESLTLLADPAFSDCGRAARAVLQMSPSVPCATVLALYDTAAVEVPAWDVWYPENSKKLLLLSHDSAKRESPQRLALVLQARPSWSASVMSAASDDWPRQLLVEASGIIGTWVERPLAFQAHMWHQARTSPDCELAGPLMMKLPNGCRVGIAGELCSPGGGIQAAWQSGKQLATRLLAEASI